jgi:hypothetical protein
MKRLLTFILSLASVGIIVLSAEAKSTGALNSPATTISANAVEAQGRGQFRRGRFYRPVRIETRTRLVHRGRQVYRETYRIRYMPNGRTQMRLISRVRIR